MKNISMALLLQFFAILSANAASCPTDFDYVHQIPWDASSCRTVGSNYDGQCCQTILSLFGVGLAQHLKDTSMFEFPDYAIATACLHEFQYQLSSLAKVALSQTLVSLCVNDTSMIVSSSGFCDGIVKTKQEWTDLLGTTAIDSSCKGDLSDQIVCSPYINDAQQVTDKLVKMNKNATDL